MDWHLVLGILSGLIPILVIAPYVRDVIKGRAKPNIVSFFLWSGIVSISLIAQLVSGASWSALFLVGDLITTGSVVILCLLGYGYTKYGVLDFICIVLAVLAIVSWQITKAPLLAIEFAVLADFAAALPTIIKAYKDPDSETPTNWLVSSFAAALGIASTTIINPENILFPAYLLIVNGVVGLLALRRKK